MTTQRDVIDAVDSEPTPIEYASPEPHSDRSSAVGAPLGSACNACRFRTTCLGHAFRSASAGSQPLVGYRRHLEPGEVLYHAGARCSLLHVIQSGFFKTVMLSADGIAQITGFQMPGDLLGLDGLSSGVHRCDAIALTGSSVCVVSRARLLQSSAENGALCRHLFSVLSDEILSDHATMLLLGSRSAEQRVGAFLVELSERLAAGGYSDSEIGLWMSREEIGSFLGLELETISRVLSSLARRRLIDVNRRHIRIGDLRGLREVMLGQDPSAPRRHALRPPSGVLREAADSAAANAAGETATIER